MTEAEWLAWIDSRQMINFINGRASDRKLRLFACACSQRTLPLMGGERSRKAVQVAAPHLE